MKQPALPNWLKQSEDSKPEYDEKKLKENKEKTAAIRDLKKKQKQERPSQYFCARKKAQALLKREKKDLNKVLSEFRSNFKVERAKRRQLLSMYKTDGLMTQVTSVLGRWTYRLQDYKPLTVPKHLESQYPIFDKLWLTYDEEGCGEISYSKFEKLLVSLGLDWSTSPSAQDIDPKGNGLITFEEAARWWFSSERPTEKRAFKGNTAKRRKTRRIRNEVQSQILSAKLVKRPRLLEDNDVKTIRKRSRATALNNRELFRSARAERRKQFAGKKRKLDNVIEVTRGSKQPRIKYDLSSYSPLDYAEMNIDDTSLQQVDKVWRSYDKDGVGKISKEDFAKLAKDLGIKPEEAPQAKMDFESFVKWWFARKNGKTSTPASKEKIKLLSDAEVKQIRQKFAKKFQDSRQKLKKHIVENSPRKAKKLQRAPRVNVDIYSKDGDKKEHVSYDITNYYPGYVPKGLETQLEHLDRVWKGFEKEGTGQLNLGQFEKFVESFGSKLEDKVIMKNLQNADGFITWERFSTWWFSKDARGVVPMAPPSPDTQKEKKAKVEAIRKTDKALADKLKAKYDLISEEELSKRKARYSEVFAEKTKKFQEFRACSPKKKLRQKGKLAIDIFTKEPGQQEIAQLSFVA